VGLIEAARLLPARQPAAARFHGVKPWPH